jgi:hypothetical protein
MIARSGEFQPRQKAGFFYCGSVPVRAGSLPFIGAASTVCFDRKLVIRPRSVSSTFAKPPVTQSCGLLPQWRHIHATKHWTSRRFSTEYPAGTE